MVDGAAVEFTSPRLRQLLALLVVHANTVVSTDRLIDVMWPDDGEAHALRTLRTNVWRLRNLLGPGADATLLTRQGGYVGRVERRRPRRRTVRGARGRRVGCAHQR